MYQFFKDFAGPVAVVAAALVAASVTSNFAWRQWKTAENKLRFDLFDRRLTVFLATKTLIDKITVHGSSTPDDLRQFYDAVKGAEFLFKADLKDYYMTIGELCWKAQMARFSQEKTKADNHRNKLIDQEESIVEFLMGERERLEHKFKKYLDLSKIGL